MAVMWWFRDGRISCGGDGGLPCLAVAVGDLEKTMQGKIKGKARLSAKASSAH